MFWEEKLLSWKFNVIFSKRHGWWNTHQMRSNIGILRWEIFSVWSASHFKTVKITVPRNSGELINSPVNLVKNAMVLENISENTQRVHHCDQEGEVPNDFLMKWIKKVGITSHNFILFRNFLAFWAMINLSPHEAGSKQRHYYNYDLILVGRFVSGITSLNCFQCSYAKSLIETGFLDQYGACSLSEKKIIRQEACMILNNTATKSQDRPKCVFCWSNKEKRIKISKLEFRIIPLKHCRLHILLSFQLILQKPVAYPPSVQLLNCTPFLLWYNS